MLYICGHIHESTGKQFLGTTPIVNCSIGDKGRGALIDLENETVQQIRML